MRIVAHTSLALTAGLEREVVENISPRIAEWLTDVGDPRVSRDRTALLVVSPNAGAATSMQFWAQAQRTGVALASPELFPWCLANAPCGALARHLHITGPNFTLLGDAQALTDAAEIADDLLSAGQIDLALVVALRFSDAVRPQGGGHALLIGAGGLSADEALATLGTLATVAGSASVWP